jgi:hypothetical protein
MRNKVLGVLAGVVLCVSAFAQSDAVYLTLNNSGTTACTNIFRAQPNRAIRIVGAIATSDKATSALSWRCGQGAYTISLSNTVGTLITVARTNGLNASDVICVQKSDGTTNVLATISSISSTNVTLAATDGVTTLPGDEVFKMGPPITTKVGAATVNLQGEAVISALKGRPVSVVVDGTSACSLDAITARYE